MRLDFPIGTHFYGEFNKRAMLRDATTVVVDMGQRFLSDAACVSAPFRPRSLSSAGFSCYLNP